MSEFETELLGLLRRKIKSLRAVGTVAMSADNLWQVSVSAISKLPSAPVGTNAAFFARQDFNEVLVHFPKFVV